MAGIRLESYDERKAHSCAVSQHGRLAHHCSMGEIWMLGTMPESYNDVYMRNVL